MGEGGDYLDRAQQVLKLVEQDTSMDPDLKKRVEGVLQRAIMLERAAARQTDDGRPTGLLAWKRRRVAAEEC